MPSHAELLGENRDLARGSESAGLRNVYPDVIDQALGDQRLPLVRAVEQLAHGDRRGAVLADLPEVAEIFRRERIFEEEHFELLGVLAELHGLVRQQAFVHVMQQFDFLAQLLAADFQTASGRGAHSTRARTAACHAAPSAARPLRRAP